MEKIRSFTQVAIPHSDILEGRLTMDVFAADLWQVKEENAPRDYQDPDLFFAKTYLTEGLNEILTIAKRRLEGGIGDSVIHLQTPFGGGKTHTLIALYHKAKEWGVRVVVLDGIAFDPTAKRLWEEVERQLTESETAQLTAGFTAPGKEKLVRLLSEYGPVLILMDEVLEYSTKAAGLKLGIPIWRLRRLLSCRRSWRLLRLWGMLFWFLLCHPVAWSVLMRMRRGYIRYFKKLLAGVNEFILL